MSCFTWSNYRGTWKRDKDSIFFYDDYEVNERETRATYKKDSKQELIITFKTDRASDLKNRNIKIEYWYDHNAYLGNLEKEFTLNANNSIIIPFSDIPNFDKLSSVRIEYLFNFTEKRLSFLTENAKANIKESDIPNIIDVEFVEKPRKEVVYRTIKGIMRGSNLIILSTAKTKIVLPDNRRDIDFEDSYTLTN
jgi:hypothetical protein